VGRGGVGVGRGRVGRGRARGTCVAPGARSRQIRRIFTAEALALALAGWVLGIGVGWLIYDGLALRYQ